MKEFFKFNVNGEEKLMKSEGGQRRYIRLTWTGRGMSCIVSAPCPSLPPLPWPQVSTPPSRVTKAEWNFWRETWQMLTFSFLNVSTKSGMARLVLVPRPRL